MSKSGAEPIKNAVEIIEQFGGIRPMAAKINVAVTTVQGWKKRDVIPATRRQLVIDAAREHNIEIDHLLNPDSVQGVETPLTENRPPSVTETLTSGGTGERKESSIEIPSPISDTPIPAGIAGVEPGPDPAAARGENAYTELHVAGGRSTVTKSAAIGVAAAFVVVVLLIAMIWPEYDRRGDRLASLEGDISDMKQAQTRFKGLVSEDWVQKLESLENQVSHASKKVGRAAELMAADANQFIEDHELDQQVVRLKTYVSELAEESGVYGLLTRYELMEETDQGQEHLDRSVEELASLLADMEGKDDAYVNGVLASAREKSEHLKATMGNVPQDEMKAAALLFATAQVRSALNRNDNNFESDLALLMNMVGDSDPELQAAMLELAPHSKNGGVLTADGLQEELQSVTGDVLAASLAGENVSFSAEASDRLNEILEIEKEDSPRARRAREARKHLANADRMIMFGNWDKAMRYLKSHLNDEELKPLRPFFKYVGAILAKQKTQKAVKQWLLCFLNDGEPRDYCFGEYYPDPPKH